MGGIYKIKKLMSLAMRLLAPNRKELTATDGGKFDALVAGSSISVKDMVQSNLNRLD